MDNRDKIEKYLLNRMTEREKADFENELQNNDLLNEQLELEQAIVGQIQKRAFIDEQINIAKKEMQGGKTIRLTIYSVVSIAAIFIMVLLVQGVWHGQQYDKMYAENFIPYKDGYLENYVARGEISRSTNSGSGSLTRGEVVIDSLLINVFMAYNKGEFTKAELQFDQLLEHQDNPELRFYLAVTQLENGKAELAIKTLQPLYNLKQDYRYFEQIRWYLSLSHLKLHHKTEAMKYLNELILLNKVYWIKAAIIMKTL